MKNFIKRLFCKHTDWIIQPSYMELYYDKCKKCGKYRDTVGEIEYSTFGPITIRIK